MVCLCGFLLPACPSLCRCRCGVCVAQREEAALSARARARWRARARAAPEREARKTAVEARAAQRETLPEQGGLPPCSHTHVGKRFVERFVGANRGPSYASLLMAMTRRYARILAGMYCAAAAEGFAGTPACRLRLGDAPARPAVCSAGPAVIARAPKQGAARGLLVPGSRRGGAATTAMMAAVDTAAVEAQIEEQGNKVRLMKEAMKSDGNAHTKAELTAEVDKLKALKAQLAPPEAPKLVAKEPAAKKPAAAKKLEKEETKVSPREERSVRIAKADKFREKGINPYAYTWKVTDSCTALQAEHKGLGNGEVAEGAKTSIAGVPCAHMCMES